jgi:hypothetical protein
VIGRAHHTATASNIARLVVRIPSPISCDVGGGLRGVSLSQQTTENAAGVWNTTEPSRGPAKIANFSYQPAATDLHIAKPTGTQLARRHAAIMWVNYPFSRGSMVVILPASWSATTPFASHEQITASRAFTWSRGTGASRREEGQRLTGSRAMASWLILARKCNCSDERRRRRRRRPSHQATRRIGIDRP